MPPKPPATSAEPEAQAPKMPGAYEVQIIREICTGLETALTDASIQCDFDLLTNSSCNGVTQSSGIGVLYNDQGDFSLITPFGHIQNLGCISEESEWQTVFDDLKKFLDEFCVSAQMTDDELSCFDDDLTGFWIISMDVVMVSNKPHILTHKEEISGILLEEEWERLVCE